MCSVYTSCHSNHQPRHTKQHECDWTAGRRLWSGLMHTKSGQAVVMALTRTHTLGENMHKRLKLQKKKTWFLSKAHTTRTIVKEDWQASMHMKKEGIMELNGKENGCGKPTQYFRGTTASKSFLGKKKKKDLQLLIWAWPLSWTPPSLVPPSVPFWLLSWCPKTSTGATCKEQSTCETRTTKKKSVWRLIPHKNWDFREEND